MLTLLDSLIVIHQLRQHALTIEPTTFDPLELLETAQQMVRERAEQHDHQINILADQSLPFVQADFDRSLNILLDILDNAIRYTPNDSVIRVSADSIGSHVLFTIADSGIGFSADDSEQVGTPFWRALHEPLVRNHHGTGLRLFLAKQVLALQGGEMFFSGEPNFGSSFSFTLPVSPA
jgi:signal transduction histidine kinase